MSTPPYTYIDETTPTPYVGSSDVYYIESYYNEVWSDGVVEDIKETFITITYTLIKIVIVIRFVLSGRYVDT